MRLTSHLKYKLTVFQLRDLELVLIIKFYFQLVKMVFSVSSTSRIRILKVKKRRTTSKLTILKRFLFKKLREISSKQTLSISSKVLNNSELTTRLRLNMSLAKRIREYLVSKWKLKIKKSKTEIDMRLYLTLRRRWKEWMKRKYLKWLKHKSLS